LSHSYLERFTRVRRSSLFIITHRDTFSFDQAFSPFGASSDDPNGQNREKVQPQPSFDVLSHGSITHSAIHGNYRGDRIARWFRFQTGRPGGKVCRAAIALSYAGEYAQRVR